MRRQQSELEATLKQWKAELKDIADAESLKTFKSKIIGQEKYLLTSPGSRKWKSAIFEIDLQTPGQFAKYENDRLDLLNAKTVMCGDKLLCFKPAT